MVFEVAGEHFEGPLQKLLRITDSASSKGIPRGKFDMAMIGVVQISWDRLKDGVLTF